VQPQACLDHSSSTSYSTGMSQPSFGLNEPFSESCVFPMKFLYGSFEILAFQMRPKGHKVHDKLLVYFISTKFATNHMMKELLVEIRSVWQ
jgi:hypothetical protein